MTARFLLLLSICLIACVRPATAQLYSIEPDGTTRPQEWFLAEDVTDPLFATMMAVIDADWFGEVGQASRKPAARLPALRDRQPQLPRAPGRR